MLIEHRLGGEVVDKVADAIAVIRQYEPPEGYIVSYSGGKDSDCILALTKMARVQYTARYRLTTVDPPELVHYIKREHPDVVVDRPKVTMWQLIAKVKHGPPLRAARW